MQQENLPICYGLHVHAKSVLFRVSYHAARINLEVSHIVSDGRGSLSFFKALLHAYIEERYGVKGVPANTTARTTRKSENSFNKYFERDKAAATRAPKVYRLTGWRDEADPTFFEYHLPAKRVLALARSRDVGVTALVIAVIMCAIRAEMPRRDRHRAIRMDVPVDLRQLFKSTTVKNFFGLAFVSYVPGDEDEPVETVAAHRAGSAENGHAGRGAQAPHEPHDRAGEEPASAPGAAVREGFRPGAGEPPGRARPTTTMSNLGPIRIDERMAPYIRDVNVLTSTTGLNFLMCSFGDDLSIGISTVYSNPDVIKNICRFFSGQGIEGRVNINKTNEEVAEDRLEAKIEASVKRWGGQTPHAKARARRARRRRPEATDAREDDGR